ncbi:TonB-dependent receptor [Ideonella sp. DXS22W]|uniref:TonB-dependent receptor n=1 Tax=Pseudaquabacterium inlustre TaxID=2984192 RepID=A0ABU9CF13_9BURK
MQLKSIVRAIALLGATLPVWAQTPDAPQRVEITGSSIKRIASEGALPVQIITPQELERQGISSAEQLISSLAINGNGLDNLASNADVVSGAARGNNGATSANLRNQGAASTLILLNGRRVASHGLNGGAVDLNQIPMAAVERIEILKDGASAIYGTDAIGGVINFILKKNFNGLQAQVFTDTTQHGGGNIARVGLTGGFGDLDRDRYNLLFAASFSDSQKLRGDQRSFVNTFQPDRGLSVDTRGTPYATVFAVSNADTILSNKSTTGPKLPGGTQAYNGINVLDLPGQAGCSSIDGMSAYDEKLWATPAAAYGCAWDTGRAAVLQQPVQNSNLVTRGTLRLGEHQLTGEVVMARSESAKSFSNAQLSTSATTPFLYPSTGAAYDTVFNALAAVFPSISANYGKPIAYRWRCMACGEREIKTVSDTGRVLLAADGPLPWLAGWDYRSGLSYAFSDVSSTLGSGYYYRDALVAAMNTGKINPFLAAGQSQTAEGLALLESTSARGVTLYGGKYEVTEADVTASGPVGKLPGGDVMVAAGLNARNENYKFNGDQRAASARPVIFLAPFDDANALAGVSRSVRAAFGEVQLPIMKQLELNLAARYDDYSGFGSTTNPKVSLRFTPMDSLLLRASYSTGFRVPTFNQLYNGITDTTYAGKDLVDPAKCASGKVDSTVVGCEAITPIIRTGGKEDLGPEESKQWTAGFVWAPRADFSVGADWWSIRRNGTIQSLSLSTLVGNYGLFRDRFITDGAGTLLVIDDRWINAGETITKGVDLNVQGSLPVMDGKLAAKLEGTYLIEKKSRLVASAPFGASEVARFTRADDLGLRWKHTLSFTYSRGAWSGALIQQYSSAYLDAVLPGVANGTVVPANWSPTVPAYTLYHASVKYTGIKNLGLTVGVKNLFDKTPPFSAAYDSNTGAGSSWEPRVADPRGRSLVLSVDYKFF